MHKGLAPDQGTDRVLAIGRYFAGSLIVRVPVPDSIFFFPSVSSGPTHSLS